MRTVTVLLGSLLLLASCTGGPGLSFESESDIERTWSQALVVLPPAVAGQEPRVERLRASGMLQAGRNGARRPRLPLVVYLHGCDGIGDLPLLKALASRGYAVIAPDSFARRFRPLQCDPARRQGGQNRFVYDFRLTELTFALERLDGLDWIDYRNLFLMGTSEGGVAAALFRGQVFNARVVAQWSCQGDPLVRGIGAPPGEPVLALMREGDPYYDPRNTPAQQGDCGPFLAGRPDSHSYLLPRSQDGLNHFVFDDPASVAVVVAFLDRNRRLARP